MVCVGFLSGKGGTGKTSLLVGIGAALAKQGKRVLCMDCDSLRGLDLAMGLTERSLMDFADVASGRVSLEDAAIEHPRQAGLYLLNAPASGGATLSEMSALMENIRERFDFCLTDAPSGIGGASPAILGAADSVVVVCGTDPLSRRNAQRVVMELDAFPSEAARLIVNGVKPSLLRRPEVTIDDIMDEVGLPLLGLVPQDEAIARALRLGVPVTIAAPDSASARACARIARRMNGESVKLPPLYR